MLKRNGPQGPEDRAPNYRRDWPLPGPGVGQKRTPIAAEVVKKIKKLRVEGLTRIRDHPLDETQQGECLSCAYLSES